MDNVEEKIINIIDKNRGRIIDFARDILANPELGYKEIRTAEKVSEILRGLVEELETNLAITGVKGYLKKKNSEDINVAIIGELDAIVVPNNQHANKKTGACHACGHHAQLAGLIGAAIALSDSEVRNSFKGNISFFAVPSEEYGEIEYKLSLKDKGLIKYGGGKSELIRIGAFDDIYISIVHHLDTSKYDIGIGDKSSNGFVSKLTRYKGKASHAAASPHLGINAVNASSIGLSSVAFQRETFKESDTVRVHSIITKGGGLVNVIPDEVVIESLVRANNIEAIIDTSKKVDRALKAGALAVGGSIEIKTEPGYLPVIPLEPSKVMIDIAKELLPNGNISITKKGEHSEGSSDVGDLTHIMPVLRFSTGGCIGQLHSSEFDIVNEEISYIITAKIMALTAYRILRDNNSEAKKIIKDFNQKFTIKEYKEYMDNLENTIEVNYENE